METFADVILLNFLLSLFLSFFYVVVSLRPNLLMSLLLFSELSNSKRRVLEPMGNIHRCHSSQFTIYIVALCLYLCLFLYLSCSTVPMSVIIILSYIGKIKRIITNGKFKQVSFFPFPSISVPFCLFLSSYVQTSLCLYNYFPSSLIHNKI